MSIGNHEKLNNKGMSLVELIVVILIMGVLSAGAVVSLTILFNARATQAIDTLSTMLVAARTEAMESGNRTVSVTVKTDDDGNMVAVLNVMNGNTVTRSESELLGNTGINITVFKTYFGETEPRKDAAGNNDPAHAVTISDDTDVTITFNYNSGGLEISGNDATGDFYYTDFYITGVGDRDGTVVILPATGRTYTE